MSIHVRKVDHLELTIKGMASYEHSSGFDRLRLKHNALPELDLSEVDTSAIFNDRRFDFPLMISSMTGGTSKLGDINAQLAELATDLNIPMGLGSQRVMLEDSQSVKSFKIARDVAPNAYICANLGGQQLLSYDAKTIINKIVDPVGADALIIHLNVLQEMMQPEGDVCFKGITNKIGELIKHLSIPLIVKETGAGISGSVSQILYDQGVRYIDVAGSGGTSWAKVENLRSSNLNPKSIFNEWGIPTVQCLIEISDLEYSDLNVISSGGIRSSLDILKSLALGAKFTATAQPVIKVLHEEGQPGLQAYLKNLKKEIQTGMLLLGVSRVSDINQEHIYIQ